MKIPLISALFPPAPRGAPRARPAHLAITRTSLGPQPAERARKVKFGFGSYSAQMSSHQTGKGSSVGPDAITR